MQGTNWLQRFNRLIVSLYIFLVLKFFKSQWSGALRTTQSNLLFVYLCLLRVMLLSVSHTGCCEGNEPHQFNNSISRTLVVGFCATTLRSPWRIILGAGRMDGH